MTARSLLCSRRATLHMTSSEEAFTDVGLFKQLATLMSPCFAKMALSISTTTLAFTLYPWAPLIISPHVLLAISLVDRGATLIGNITISSLFIFSSCEFLKLVLLRDDQDENRRIPRAPSQTKVERLLSKVDQVPSISMQDALQPSMKALIADELLRHADMDVKVSVASCISEITRITAPNAPFNDEQMKEFYQLSVMAFEKLSYMSGRCYSKAVAILETVANFRSCLVMLDLELDALIVEMFKQFLNTIQSNHPHAVFSDMEIIMTLVIEQSEELPFELLSPLLSSVKKENQNVSPLSWKLGEKVLKNCAAKLKPYLPEAVRSMGIAFDDYAEIVALICQDASGRETLETRELVLDAICLGEVGPSVGGSSKSVMNDGTAQMRKDDTLEDENSLQILGCCSQTKQQKSTDARTDSQPENLDTTKVVQQELDPEVVPKKRGRKPNSLLKPEEGYDHSWISGGRKFLEIPRCRKNHRKKVSSLPNSSASKESALPSGTEKKTQLHVLSPKISQSESMNASSSQSYSFPDGNHPRRGLPKRKENVMNQDSGPDLLSVSEGDFLRAQVEEGASQCAAFTLRKESDGTEDSKAKCKKGSRKNVLAAKTDLVPGDPERKQESSIQQMDAKKQSRCRTLSTKHVTEKSGNKARRKRKSTPSKEEASEMTRVVKDYGEKLVGCKIKVWWPKDKTFYEGFITSFDNSKMKHQVIYVDGDRETLDLKRERWELVGDVNLPVQGQENILGPNASADMFCDDVIDSFDPTRKKHKVQLINHLTPVAASKMHVGHSPTLPQTDSCSRTNFKKSQNEERERPLTEILPIRAAPPSTSQVAYACGKMADVQGYKVKASAAPVLRTIFAKHGDVAANCLYKSASVRASLLEVICNVVLRLQSNDLAVIISELEAIENEISDAEAAKLEVSWLRELLAKIPEGKKIDQGSSMLKDVKTNSILVVRAATKELEQSQVELVAAQERVKEAKRCVEALKLVSRKIDNDILEYEAVENSWRRALEELL